MTPQARTNDRSGKVLYKGTSHVRRISKADFKAVGIEHDTLEWSAQNLFMVPMDKITLSEAEFDRVIKADEDFAIIDQDKAEAGLPKSHPANNRFQQPEAFTEGTPGAGDGPLGAAPTTTVGGSTSGATPTGGGTAT